MEGLVRPRVGVRRVRVSVGMSICRFSLSAPRMNFSAYAQTNLLYSTPAVGKRGAGWKLGLIWWCIPHLNAINLYRAPSSTAVQHASLHQ